MEKRNPHCSLERVRELIRLGRVVPSATALRSAYALGINFEGMVAIVLALAPRDFYKSMTTHADHTIWQDVYHPSSSAGDLYLKLTVVDEVVIVSFKEL